MNHMVNVISETILDKFNKINKMENVIIQRVKDQLKNLKTLSEELEVQMALGKAEAKDLFKQERKNISKFIEKEKNILNESNTGSEESRRSFLSKIENLESSINAEIPSSASNYDTYKTKVLKNIYQVEEVIKENDIARDRSFNTTLDSFKTKMDAFRVNLALHDKDNPEKVERVRNDFTTKLTEVRGILAKDERDEANLDNFTEDIKQSFHFFKKAIEDLSK